MVRPGNKEVNYNLPHELAEQLKAEAKARDRHHSEIVLWAVRRFLSRRSRSISIQQVYQEARIKCSIPKESDRAIRLEAINHDRTISAVVHQALFEYFEESKAHSA